MKKTLLLIPPLSLQQRMGSLAEGGAVMPGLGLLYIAAYMRKEGLPVSIVDAEGLLLDMDKTVEFIIKQKPDIVGITATTVSIIIAAETALKIKQTLPNTKIIIGGPHITALPEETMQSFTAIDGGILGDGEISFTQLVKNITNEVVPHNNIDGIIWRSGESLAFKPKTRHLQDLDSLPFPAWDMLEGFPEIYRPPFHSYRKLPVANIITTRGCPYACSFCDRSVFGKKTYSHSIEYVLGMIEQLVKDYGVREIAIKDDMFVVSKDRVFEFCEGLRKKNLKILWSCNARVNFINDELLKEMASSGCWMISYGIESGSPEMLKKMMKGITKEQVINALNLTRKHGIVSKGFFMIGIPGETVKTMQETLDFIKELPLDELNINCFTPFPGSRLYNEALAEGFKPDFSRMNMIDTAYVPIGLTEKLLKQYQKKIIYSFYLKPSKMLLYSFRALKDLNEFKRIYRMSKVFITMIYKTIKNR